MLNASNPGCFTENNPGTAASVPGSCAGADFKETAGPETLLDHPGVYAPSTNRPRTTARPDQIVLFIVTGQNYDRFGIHCGAFV